MTIDRRDRGSERQIRLPRRPVSSWMIAAFVAVAASLGLTWAGVAMVSARGAPAASAPRPVPSGYPPAKAARFSAADQLRQQASFRPLVPPKVVPTQAEYTPGILGLRGGGPLNSSELLGTNLWNGPLNGTWEVIQAGGVPVTPKLGAASSTTAGVFVYWVASTNPSSPGPETVKGIIQPANPPVGQFTILRAAANVLTLSLSGSTAPWYFNIGTLSFSR